eukprot:1707626-Alexandrium_andersonii.AAC.1
MHYAPWPLYREMLFHDWCIKHGATQRAQASVLCLRGGAASEDEHDAHEGPAVAGQHSHRSEAPPAA